MTRPVRICRARDLGVFFQTSQAGCILKKYTNLERKRAYYHSSFLEMAVLCAFGLIHGADLHWKTARSGRKTWKMCWQASAERRRSSTSFP